MKTESIAVNNTQITAKLASMRIVVRDLRAQSKNKSVRKCLARVAVNLEGAITAYEHHNLKP